MWKSSLRRSGRGERGVTMFRKFAFPLLIVSTFFVLSNTPEVFARNQGGRGHGSSGGRSTYAGGHGHYRGPAYSGARGYAGGGHAYYGRHPGYYGGRNYYGGHG